MLEACTRPAVSLLMAVLLLAGFAWQIEVDDADEAEKSPALRISFEPPAFTIPVGVELTSDLVYAERPTRPLRLDLYRSTAVQDSLPVIVFIHGGGWRSGGKEEPAIIELTEHGYAVASIEYRLSDEAVFPAQLEDCRAAVRWLRTHAKEWQLDTQRIGVCGISTGGHLASLLGVTESTDPQEAEFSAVQAVADFCGPTDLLTLSRVQTETGLTFEADAYSPESLLLGELPQLAPDLARAASPLHQVRTDQSYPPFMIVHGHKDAVVPWSQSYHFAIRLRQSGTRVHYQTSENTHQSMLYPQQLDELCAFFDETLAVPGQSPAATPLQVTQADTASRRETLRNKSRRKRNAAGVVTRPAAS